MYIININANFRDNNGVEQWARLCVQLPMDRSFIQVAQFYNNHNVG